MKTKILGLSLILVIIGAINWGSIGLFGLDLVASLFGVSPYVVRILYTIVGVAGACLAFVAKDILGFFGKNLLK